MNIYNPSCHPESAIFTMSVAFITTNFLPQRAEPVPPRCGGCALQSSCCGWGQEDAQKKPTRQTWLNTQLQTSMRNCILGRWCSSISSIKVGCPLCRERTECTLFHTFSSYYTLIGDVMHLLLCSKLHLHLKTSSSFKIHQKTRYTVYNLN